MWQGLLESLWCSRGSWPALSHVLEPCVLKNKSESPSLSQPYIKRWFVSPRGHRVGVRSGSVKSWRHSSGPPVSVSRAASLFTKPSSQEKKTILGWGVVEGERLTWSISVRWPFDHQWEKKWSFLMGLRAEETPCRELMGCLLQQRRMVLDSKEKGLWKQVSAARCSPYTAAVRGAEIGFGHSRPLWLRIPQRLSLQVWHFRNEHLNWKSIHNE